MKRIFLATVFLGITLTLHAAESAQGKERLRELTVFPQLDSTVNFMLKCDAFGWWVGNNESLPGDIAALEEDLKQHPADIQKRLHLSFLLGQTGQTNEARLCDQETEQLCRKAMASRPQDGLLLTELGQSLWGADQDPERERLYRKAVSVSSNEWRCWVCLGYYLQGRASNELIPERFRNQVANGNFAGLEAAGYQPSPEAFKRSEEAAREAEADFQRALALAPGEPEVYVQHQAYLAGSNLCSYFVRYFREHQKPDASMMLSAYFSAAALADLKKAAGLNDNDYRLIDEAAYFDWMRAMVVLTQGDQSKPFTPDILPGDTRRYISNTLTRLAGMTKDLDQKQQAGALESHAFLSLILTNYPDAIADTRRAVALDPGREASWDMLLGSLVSASASPDELVSVCEARLKSRDSARNHLFLAKAFTKAGAWPKAEEQAEAAVRLEPDNLTAQIMLAALEIRQGGEAKSLERAKEHLHAAGLLAVKMPDDQQKVRCGRDLALDSAIYAALLDKNDEAKKLVNAALKMNPNDEDAQTILGVIE